MMPSETLTRPDTDTLQTAIEAATAALLARQEADGHWLFELEADATIPSEYVLLEHYLDRIDPALEARIGVYLRGIQNPDGGWPLFHDGASDLSVSVKAYFALKAVGDLADAPHMANARARILEMGGAERTNVFCRVQLALFGQVPWRATPVMPVEIMHLPRWFFFHLSKVSYWSRTVMVPLLVRDGAAAAGAQPARDLGGGVVLPTAGHGARLVPWPVPLRLGAGLPPVGHAAAPAGAAFPPPRPRPGDRVRHRLHGGAAERRGRAGAPSTRPWPTA